jgi:hypothetical protein
MIRLTIPALALVAMTTGSLSFADTMSPASCSCAGPFSDREESPFAHRAYVANVTPYKVITIDKRRRTKLEGATVQVLAAPGVTGEWLQGLVDDHMGRNASPSDASWDPLALGGITAQVEPHGDDFAITIRSSDHATAEEVLRRADSLVME